MIKSLENSETLKLSDDWLSVWRWWRFCINEKLEKKLNSWKIYVEGYPPQANSVQIAKIFNWIGFITDISMPRYSTTSWTWKGYAFITFESEE